MPAQKQILRGLRTVRVTGNHPIEASVVPFNSRSVPYYHRMAISPSSRRPLCTAERTSTLGVVFLVYYVILSRRPCVSVNPVPSKVTQVQIGSVVAGGYAVAVRGQGLLPLLGHPAKR
jgi:hypothetical protein